MNTRNNTGLLYVRGFTGVKKCIYCGKYTSMYLMTRFFWMNHKFSLDAPTSTELGISFVFNPYLYQMSTGHTSKAFKLLLTQPLL